MRPRSNRTRRRYDASCTVAGYGATAESAPRDQIVLVKLGSGQLEGTLALRSVTGGAETNLSFVVDPAVRPLRATFASGTGNIVEVTARGFTLIGCERWMPRVQTGQANSCQFSRAG